MEKEDIVNGLRQAMSRGDSLQRAKQSFVNAGYSPRDVEDSANVLQNSVSSLTMTTDLPNIQTPYPKATQRLPQIPKYTKPQDSAQPIPQPPIQQAQQPVQQTNKIIQQAQQKPSLPPIPQFQQQFQPAIIQQNIQQPEKKEVGNKTIAILVGILVILLGVLGASLYFMNKGA